jgi:hypothetical protein
VSVPCQSIGLKAGPMSFLSRVAVPLRKGGVGIQGFYRSVKEGSFFLRAIVFLPLCRSLILILSPIF